MAEAQPTVNALPEAPGAPGPRSVQTSPPGGSISARLDGLSADDLLQELRARVDEGGTPRESLREVESADIAQQLKFLQRQVYRPDEGQDFTIFGADDRRELFHSRTPGTPMTGWARLDGNPQTAGLAADGTQLYQRHHNGQIYRYTGVPMSGWAAVDTG